ncbi:MAG: hypothetical protein J2P36_22300 [Ktedonobacteraceae bacterium]|nr:hypothetical protein [Ktedonobacteraceae bacterium]
MKKQLTSHLAHVPKWVIMGAVLCTVITAIFGMGVFQMTHATHAVGTQQVFIWATQVIVRSDHHTSSATITPQRVSRQQVTAVCQVLHTGDFATGSDSHHTYRSDNWVFIRTESGATGWVSVIWVRTPTDVVPGLGICRAPNPKAV